MGISSLTEGLPTKNVSPREDKVYVIVIFVYLWAIYIYIHTCLCLCNGYGHITYAYVSLGWHNDIGTRIHIIAQIFWG